MVAITGTTGLTNNNKSRFALVCLLVALAPVAGQGAEFGGGATVGVSRTDNVFLDTSPNEVDDLIYRASPYIDFTHESPGLDARLNYRYDWYRYADLKRERSYHMGRAQLTGKAWEESLQVELGASRRQVLTNPNDVIPGGRLPLSGNLTDRDEYWINPRLQRPLGRIALLNVSYRYSEGKYDDPDIQDDTNQAALFSIDNYSAGQGVTWALRYNWRRTEYEISPPWEHQQASAELGYWANSKARIFAAGGKESAWDMPFDPALADPFWEAGFAYTAGENLSAEFAAGERSFGSSWRGKLDYEFRRGGTSLNYVETPMTVGFSRSNRVPKIDDPDDPDDPDGLDVLDDFLNQPGSAERYLSKRFDWNTDLEFRRTKFVLSVFYEDRSDRVSADGTPRSDQSQTGARTSFSWQAGVRTTFTASGSIIDRESGVTNKSRFIGARLKIKYEIGARTDLALSYKYSDQQPRGDLSTSRDYVANVVSLLFTITM